MRAERYRWLLLLAASGPVAVAAADPPAPVAPLAAADAELLEFLGEFGDAGGEFVDPFVIEAVGSELEAAQAEAAKKQKEQDKKAKAEGAPKAPLATPEARPEDGR